VGMAVADDRRRTGDCHLDGILQKEVLAQAEDRRGVILQTYRSVWPRFPCSRFPPGEGGLFHKIGCNRHVGLIDVNRTRQVL
jgi:hypothetical protein